MTFTCFYDIITLGDFMKYEFYNKTKGMDEMYKVWHCSPDGMIIYFLSSGGSIVFNHNIYEIKHGVLCYVAPGCYHYTMPDAPADYTRSKIFFSASSTESLKNLSGFEHIAEEFKEKSVIYAEIPFELQSAVEQLFDNFSDPGNNLYYGSLLSLMAYLTTYKTDTIQSPKDTVISAVSYINTHISEEISIDDICNAVHMSKCYLCRKFKQVTGQTIMEYILATRLTLAKNMLKTENLSVSEISEKCGFSSTAYFCRVFHEATGTTALKYRKSH